MGLVALSAALLFTAGCASTGKQEPIAQRLPRGASCVALVSISTKRQLTAGVPNLQYGSKEEGARVVGLGPAKGILENGGDAIGAAPGIVPGLVVAVAWLPPGALLGVAYGAATGVQDSEIQAAIQSANKFVNHHDFEAELIRKLSSMAWTDHEIGLNSFGANGPDATYASLSQRGFRHVIEMEMGAMTLDGDYELRNPRVGLRVDVTAKLYRLRGSSREEVHLMQVRYRGEKQRFVRWMADDAKAFRAEVDKCQRTIAAQVLEAFAK